MNDFCLEISLIITHIFCSIGVICIAISNLYTSWKITKITKKQLELIGDLEDRLKN